MLGPQAGVGQVLGCMSEKKSGCLVWFLGICLVVSLLSNIGLIMGPLGKGMVSSSGGPVFEEHPVEPAGQDWASGGMRIAEVRLDGVISGGQSSEDGPGLESLEWQFRKAREDAGVGAVLLRVDSPGGEVTASEMLYEAVRKTREKKPVVVSMQSVAASGGYYAACGGSYITAYDTTITASIGVILQSMNYKELASKVGVQVQTFKSGAMKDLLNGARDLTEEERRYVQGMIDQSYDRFVGVVARERHLEESALRQGVADGRIMSGTDALEAKLVDSVGGWQDALAKARELAKSPGAPVFRYQEGFHFGRLSRILSNASAPGRVQVDWASPGGGRLLKGRLYFINPLLIP